METISRPTRTAAIRGTQDNWLTIPMDVPHSNKVYNYTNKEQFAYIVGDATFPKLSGIIMVARVQKDGVHHSFMSYFNTITAQITRARIDRTHTSAWDMLEFITKCVEAGDLPGEHNHEGSVCNFEVRPNYSLILIPKNLSRQWVTNNLLKLHIVTEPYKWDYPNFPQGLKDVAKDISKVLKEVRVNDIDPVQAFTDINSNIIKRLDSLGRCAIESNQHPNTQLTRKTPRQLFGVGTGVRSFSTSAYLSSGVQKPKPVKFDYSKTRQNRVVIETEVIDSSVIGLVMQATKRNIVDKIKVDPSIKLKIKLRMQLKCELANGGYRSISMVDIVAWKDLLHIEDGYIKLWEQTYGEHYSDTSIKAILVEYKILDPSYPTKISSFIKLDNHRKSFTPAKVNKSIPNNMDFKSWGPTKFNEIIGHHEITIGKTSMSGQVTVHDGGQKHVVVLFYKGAGKPINFVDERCVDNPETVFTRKFDRGITYTYVSGKIVHTIQVPQNQAFMTKLLPQKEPSYKIATMDLETREVKGVLEPVCISLYTCRTIIKDGVNFSENVVCKTFDLWTHHNKEAMINAAFKHLLAPKFTGYNIYFHNFSKFDSIFLLKDLCKFNEIELDPKIRDGSILSIKLKYNHVRVVGKLASKPACSLTIYDSQLILPISLEKLIRGFGTPEMQEYKGMFPHKFWNSPNFSWDYVGAVPGIEYFYAPKSLDLAENLKFIERYKQYASQFKDSCWSHRKELIKYCENDVKATHHVIVRFAMYIYDRYRINMMKYPTLPSIALAVYRTMFLEEGVIPIIRGTMYSDLCKSYYGGFVDVYRAFVKGVISYDINSLYPFAMARFLLPTGSPRIIEGVGLKLAEYYGFAKVRVTCPKDIHTPILPHKTTTAPYTTLYPVGSWTGWYYIPELLNAAKYGYTFEVIKIYEFDSCNLFGGYVDTLYTAKQNSTPGSAVYVIVKLLLNSLYGRFGMHPEAELTVIIHASQLDEFVAKEDIAVTEVVRLGNKVLVKYIDMGPEGQELNNISVSVASAITAQARVIMVPYIMANPHDICAIDTDGIKVTKPISRSQVGSELGQMKFEGLFKEAVFLAPKVYGGIYTDNTFMTKAKGIKEAVTYWQLKYLISSDKLEIPNVKWYRDMSRGKIVVKDQIYTLSATPNKREIIRDSMGQFVYTRPYILVDGVLTPREPFTLHYLPAPTPLLCLPAPAPLLCLPTPAPLLCLPSSTPILSPALNINKLDAASPAVIAIYPSLPPIIYVVPSSYKKQAINCYNYVDKSTTTYISIREAAKDLHISRNTISRLLSTNLTVYKSRNVFYRYELGLI